MLAASFDEARSRIGELQRLDGPEILPEAHTVLLDHGAKTPLAVVLLHGFTNHPGQYRQFAPRVFERGVNVLIPRLPEHGDRDRLTTRLTSLTVEMLIERSTQAIGAAAGLGDRVRILGISSSGLLCAYFAQYFSAIDRAVVVSPEFAILDFSRTVSRLAALAMRLLPNMFLWWDPRVKNDMHPLTAYPRFPTHALAQTLRLADEVYDSSKAGPFAAGLIRVAVNCNDPAVNNRVTERVVAQWNALRKGADVYEFTDLPRNHDIIEPDNPHAAIERVYPVLIRLLLEAAP